MLKYIKYLLKKEGIEVFTVRRPEYITLENAGHLLNNEVFCRVARPELSPRGEIIIPRDNKDKLFKFVLNELGEPHELNNGIIHYSFGEFFGAHYTTGDIFYSFFEVPKDKNMEMKKDDTTFAWDEKIDEYNIGNKKIVVYEFTVNVCLSSGIYDCIITPLLTPNPGQIVKINPEQLSTPEERPVKAKFIRAEGSKCFVQYKDITLKLPLEEIINNNEEDVEYIKEAFKKGKIVCMTTPGDDLYKLSVINHKTKEYAFIGLNGSAWATGKSKDIEELIEDYMDDIIIFDDESEYTNFLKGEFLDEV